MERDPLAVAWRLAGTTAEPSAEHTASAAVVEQAELLDPCARCGTRTGVVRTRSVVSPQFSAFDRWVNPSARWMCEVCAWGFSDRRLRAGPWVVTAQTAGPLTVSALAELLSGAVDAGSALSVPFRPGRKHLLPEAEWGAVVTDDGVVRWSQADADRLAVMSRLRGRGFGSAMLMEPAPPWAVLVKQDLDELGEVLGDWDRLDPWRQRMPWMRLAVHATSATAVDLAPASAPVPAASRVPEQRLASEAS